MQNYDWINRVFTLILYLLFVLTIIGIYKHDEYSHKK